MERFEAFIGFNFWTALFVLLNTLTVFFVGKKYLFGPVMNLIRQRQQQIDRMYSDARQATDEAQLLRSDYAQKLNRADEESRQILSEAVAMGTKHREEILRQAKQQAAVIRDQAAADGLRLQQKAMEEAKGQVAGLALAIAGKLLGAELSAARHQAMVDSWIDELEARL